MKRQDQDEQDTAAARLLGSSRAARKQPPARNRLAQFLFRPRVLIFFAAILSATVIIPTCIKWLPNLSDRSDYRLKTAGIEINEPPRYVPEDLVAQVIELADLPEELSLLDDGVTATMADAFRRHPWVAEVVAVKKSAPARLTIELRYRQPVAMIEVQQGVYPVDVEGCLLPPTDFTVADTKRYPLVRNVQTTPRGPAGTNWGDVNVSAAARLAEPLGRYWKEWDLAAIQVPRQTTATVNANDLQFELMTKNGSRILWGRAPGTKHPGELTVEQKIGRLRKYRSDFGGFDQPHGPYEIDIRHWREISRRPFVPHRREVRSRPLDEEMKR